MSASANTRSGGQALADALAYDELAQDEVDAAAAGSAGKRRVCALSLKALEATLEGCSAPS